MEVREFARILFEKGRSMGFKNMEVYVEQSDEFDVRVFKAEIDQYNVSNTMGLGFRGDYNGTMGYSYTEKLDDASIDMLLKDAKENAMIVDSEDVVEIIPASESYPEVKTFSEELEAVSADDKIKFTRDLEASALARNDLIDMVNFALMGSFKSSRQIINTKGADLSSTRNGMFAYVSVVAKNGEDVKNAGKHKLSSRWNDFRPAELAAEAADEAVSKLGATSVPSGSYSVILRNDVAGDFLQTFASIFSAEVVQKGLSLLEGMIGDTIASPKVTLVDDPLLADGALSTPFDAEGMATRTKNVIDVGVLKTFLHNSKTAKKDGVESTGNAYRASFKSSVEVAPTNMFIQKGSKSFDELVAQMGKGIIITEAQGMHSGANPVSGDFSLAAGGYLVENGQIVKAVEQITVAGNFLQMLKGVAEVGNDLEFGLPAGACYGSPSLLIDKLSVAG